MQALIGRSRRLPRTPLLLFISTSVLASGEDCVTRHEFEALREETAALRAQVAALKEQQRQKQVGVDTAPVSLSVSPLGGMTRAGRQLSAATCCRWTPGGTCSSGDVTSGCTELHEYLEHKTTTHEFAAIETCLGTDSTKFGFSYDGTTSNVTLSYDSSAVAAIPTPLKVSHAANCQVRSSLSQRPGLRFM